MTTYYIVHMKDLDAREGFVLDQYTDYLAARERFNEAAKRLGMVQGCFRVWISAAGDRQAEQLDIWESGR